jgi:hypothetical protein
MTGGNVKDMAVNDMRSTRPRVVWLKFTACLNHRNCSIASRQVPDLAFLNASTLLRPKINNPPTVVFCGQQ